MNKDLQLSPDGDLVLGQQLTDDEGYLLYYANQMHGLDERRVTRDADQGRQPVRDMALVYGEQSLLQLIKHRVQTDNPDWAHYPQVGADLSDLVGQPNSPQTAHRGTQMIQRALTYDGAFTNEELVIDCVPVGPNELFFTIKLNKQSIMAHFGVALDLTIGIVNVYELGEES